MTQDHLHHIVESVSDDRSPASPLLQQLGSTRGLGSERFGDSPLSRRSALHQIAVVAAGAALATVNLGSGGNAAAQAATPAPGACSPATPTATGGATSSGCVEVGMFDIYFSPNLLTMPADKPVTVQVKNNGVTLHNFSITDHKNPDVKNLNISLDVDPGKLESVVIEAPAGDYYFYCNVPGHEQAGMFGFIQVKADAEIKAESATVTPPAGS